MSDKPVGDVARYAAKLTA